MALSVIILTYNESLHVRRCIESVLSIAPRIVVVDSYSTDDTCRIAQDAGAEVYQNTFVNQAQQFQWAVDNCSIDTEWIMRLDADELIESDLLYNIQSFMSGNVPGVNGAIFNRKHIFLGRWVRFGGRYPLPMLRLFRAGTAHVEQRWMDEHIVLDSGKAVVLEGGFADDNLNSVAWFIDKHNKYATREMVDIMLNKITGVGGGEITSGTGFSIRMKRWIKQNVYLKFPYFLRPTAYFLFRYFAQLGFLDGAKGFAYHFLQGFWYRCLVDLKCMEFEMKIVGLVDRNSKILALQQLSGYDLSSHIET